MLCYKLSYAQHSLRERKNEHLSLGCHWAKKCDFISEVHRVEQAALAESHCLVRNVLKWPPPWAPSVLWRSMVPWPWWEAVVCVCSVCGISADGACVHMEFPTLTGVRVRRLLTSSRQSFLLNSAGRATCCKCAQEIIEMCPWGIKIQTVQRPFWSLQKDLSPNVRMWVRQEIDPCQGWLDTGFCCLSLVNIPAPTGSFWSIAVSATTLPTLCLSDAFFTVSQVRQG